LLIYVFNYLLTNVNALQEGGAHSDCKFTNTRAYINPYFKSNAHKQLQVVDEQVRRFYKMEEMFHLFLSFSNQQLRTPSFQFHKKLKKNQKSRHHKDK
jgi:hypothetical protein